jgi:hypothetical protein
LTLDYRLQNQPVKRAEEEHIAQSSGRAKSNGLSEILDITYRQSAFMTTLENHPRKAMPTPLKKPVSPASNYKAEETHTI